MHARRRLQNCWTIQIFFNLTSLWLESWISHDSESSDGPTWSANTHPKVWPWADLMFCSSRRHINRGIIPLMLKLSFVQILLASTWVTDTADKWLFLPATPPTSRLTNWISPSCNAGPFNMTSVCTTFGQVQTYMRAYLHLGQGGGAKSEHAQFTVTDEPYQSTSEAVTTHTGSFRNKNTHQCFQIRVLGSKEEHKEKNIESTTHSSFKVDI